MPVFVFIVILALFIIGLLVCAGRKTGFFLPVESLRPPSDATNDYICLMDYICHYDSPLGSITLGSDGEALTGLWFDGQKFFGNTLQPQHQEADLPVFQETRRWLDVYFSGREPGFTPKIRIQGTPFRMAVWKTLLNIPYGKTMTYGEITARVAASSEGVRMSAQAVGGAVGHNPISLIIPCHRVLGADGKLTGYASGLDRKNRLLQMEKTAVFGKSGTFRLQNL